MIGMILKELLDYFDIEGEFPEYLLAHPFNKIFLDGDLTSENGSYKVAVTTRQNVTHQMFLRPGDEYPLVILSELPNGSLNGMKFAQNENDVKYINGL